MIINLQQQESIACGYSTSNAIAFDFQVKVQDPLVVLMSALQCWDHRGKNDAGEFVMTYTFDQPVAAVIVTLKV